MTIRRPLQFVCCQHRSLGLAHISVSHECLVKSYEKRYVVTVAGPGFKYNQTNCWPWRLGDMQHTGRDKTGCTSLDVILFGR